jgi:thiamine biosynthesis lipoprotein
VAAHAGEPEVAPAEAPVVTRTQQMMSTNVIITVAAPESIQVLQAIEAGFGEVARLTHLLSEWLPDSEVSRVNQQAGIAPVPVSEELFHVVEKSIEVGRESEGTFDITWAALAGLWDFKAAKPRVPTPEELRPRLALIDYRKVALDHARHSIYLQKAGMRMGLGGIAKGYIVDRVSGVLLQRGFANHVVVAGGEVFAAGRRGGKKWTVGILHPRDQQVFAELEIENEAVTTSGNYERYFVLEGVRYHHILDPRTGMPSRGMASATILAKSAFEADSYDTACVLLGEKKALALARRRGFEVLLFDDAYHATSTPGLRARLGPAPIR